MQVWTWFSKLLISIKKNTNNCRNIISWSQSLRHCTVSSNNCHLYKKLFILSWFILNNQNTTAYRSNKLYYSDNSYSSNNKCLIRALTKFYMTLHNNDHVILILLCKMYLMAENVTVFWQIKYNSSNIFSSNHDYRMTIVT